MVTGLMHWRREGKGTGGLLLINVSGGCAWGRTQPARGWQALLEWGRPQAGSRAKEGC